MINYKIIDVLRMAQKASRTLDHQISRALENKPIEMDIWWFLSDSVLWKDGSQTPSSIGQSVPKYVTNLDVAIEFVVIHIGKNNAQKILLKAVKESDMENIALLVMLKYFEQHQDIYIKTTRLKEKNDHDRKLFFR